MKMTVIGLFESKTLEEAVKNLQAAGVIESQISVLTQPGPIQERLGGDAQQTIVESAGAGALGGAALGGLVGILAAASQIFMPGIGPVLALGSLATALGSGAGSGAGIGAAFGGFLGALIGLGMSEEDAHLYVEGVRQGNAVVAAEVDADKVAATMATMRQAGALSTDSLKGTWSAPTVAEAKAEDEGEATDSSEPLVQPEALAVLNDLIAACETATDDFQIAARNVKGAALVQFFDANAQQFAGFASDLRQEVEHAGGEPHEGTRLPDALLRGWVNIKAAMTIQRGNAAKVVLDATEKNLQSMLELYREAFTRPLTEGQRARVEQQYALTQQSYADLGQLQDLTESET